MIQDHIREAIAKLPAVIEPQVSGATRELYAALHAGLTSGVAVESDVAYGAHARHRLDVFSKAGARHDAILIYVHGGGFTAGDKRAFANIGAWCAHNGILGVTMTYRLSPEAVWPHGAEDVAAAVAWARASAARYQANAARIVVFGHSAGASHVASYLFDPDLRGHEKAAGGILVSGTGYMLEEGRLKGASLDYFGADAGSYARRSAINHVNGTRIPILLALAERDPGFLVAPTLALAQALTLRDDRSPRIYWLEGHNHFSPPASIGTSDDELSGAIRRFVASLP